MNKEQIDLLGEYIKIGNYPILIEDIPESVVEKGAVVINSDCSNSELIGHYEGTEYVEPKWYTKLINSSVPILIIDKINTIPEEEQRKFIELLKYRKSYIYELPENCKIFVTYSSNFKENKINEEVYSFLVHI